MATRTAAVDAAVELDIPRRLKVIIPNKAVKLPTPKHKWANFFGGDDDVRITIHGRTQNANSLRLKLDVRAVPNTSYPEWERQFNSFDAKPRHCTFGVEVTTLLDALKRLDKVVKEGNRQVLAVPKLKLKETGYQIEAGKLTLYASDATGAIHSETVPIEYDSDKLYVLFNRNYVMDVLDMFKKAGIDTCNGTLPADCSTGSARLAVTGDAHMGRHLIMSMRPFDGLEEENVNAD